MKNDMMIAGRPSFFILSGGGGGGVIGGGGTTAGIAEVSVCIGPEHSNWESVPLNTMSGAFQIPVSNNPL